MSKLLNKISSIIISRTDSIGDSVLTLPLCGYIKSINPKIKIIYLGKAYVADVIKASRHIDDFAVFSEDDKDLTATLKSLKADAIIHVFPRKEIAIAAKEAGIKYRVGTTGRAFHLLNCNKRVHFSRKRSEFHEAQLNFKLLKGLDVNHHPKLSELNNLYGVKQVDGFIKSKHVLIHPGSKGSAVEWSISNFVGLCDKLIKAGYTVGLTGTEEEGAGFRDAFNFNDSLVDHTGKLSLLELVDLIKNSWGIIACSTGPLHIAAMYNVNAIGLFVDIKPIHPGRWQPVGSRALVLTPKNVDNRLAINTISPLRVMNAIEKMTA